MKAYLVLCLTFLLTFTVDARRRNRQRSLSQCHRVIASQSRGQRDCSGYQESIMNDLRTVQSGRRHLDVFDRWIEDRARAMNPDINFETLVASGSCNRMMCFKMYVEQWVRQDGYEVPDFCKDKTEREYKRESRTVRRTRDWTAHDMITVYCAKAYDPEFKFH